LPLKHKKNLHYLYKIVFKEFKTLMNHGLEAILNSHVYS